MSVSGTKAAWGRRFVAAVVILTTLSSCAYLGSFGAHMKQAFGLGECRGDANRQVAQPVGGAQGGAAEGGHVVLYSPAMGSSGADCAWDNASSKRHAAENPQQAINVTSVVSSAVQADVDLQGRGAAVPLAQQAQEATAELPTYLGIETTRLDDVLVEVIVRLSGDVNNDIVAAYAECGAAQYTLSRGYGFLRHVLTSVKKKNGVWTGKSVYWVSEALPSGLITIDAAVTAQACFENGIPTV